jgi:hypothetical protein
MTKHVGFEIIDGQKKKSPKDALQNAIPFIKSIIAMHKKYAELLGNCFSNHVAFKAAFDKAFTEIMNRPTGKWRCRVS